MGDLSHGEAEQCWLELALRSVRTVASSPSEPRALRWQATALALGLEVTEDHWYLIMSYAIEEIFSECNETTSESLPSKSELTENPINYAKVIILGASGVGKTSIIKVNVIFGQEENKIAKKLTF